MTPLLLRVIHAVRHAPYDPGDRAGHDAALLELGRWALVRVPSAGVLAPDEPHAYKVIQNVAERHLGLTEARAAVREALSSVEPFDRRDAIESAHNQFQSASDDAYYYAGLACGITLADLATLRFDSRSRSWFDDYSEKP